MTTLFMKKFVSGEALTTAMFSTCRSSGSLCLLRHTPLENFKMTSRRRFARHPSANRRQNLKQVHFDLDKCR
ncbi:MAG: hypothetical protein GX874_05340 [Smithella sp.]|nr:hypothetical protein [Smithella sp.]